MPQSLHVIKTIWETHSWIEWRDLEPEEQEQALLFIEQSIDIIFFDRRQKSLIQEQILHLSRNYEEAEYEKNDSSTTDANYRIGGDDVHESTPNN